MGVCLGGLGGGGGRETWGFRGVEKGDFGGGVCGVGEGEGEGWRLWVQG